MSRASSMNIAIVTLLEDYQIIALEQIIASKINGRVVYVQIKDGVVRRLEELRQCQAVVLLHSVDCGRLSLTDVPDGRYNTILPKLKGIFGKYISEVLLYDLITITCRFCNESMTIKIYTLRKNCAN